MKVLVVSEYHILNTGYATYYKNICEALHGAGHEVFELAAYGNENLHEHVQAAKKCPWNVFLNIPSVKNQSAWAAYNESKNTKFDTDFCSWNFENIVLECLPDVVIAIRDHWYDKFILDSPLAKYYTVILSPTVDSRPQRFDWLGTFQKVDVLTFYTQWSEDWMKAQYNGPNIVKHVAPAAHPSYRPLDKEMSRKKLGLPLNNKILLTVMRNQNRKQYPYLLEAFSRVKDKSTLLYCHTHFEDRGWDIPKLLLQNSISDRVYFTYKCTECFDISSDILKINNVCTKCNSKKEVCSVQEGTTTDELNFVYNSADLYVQWANSEGLGYCQLEAAACGLKIITVNYSAPEDVADKTLSFAIDPISLQREMGTLCNRAIPDNNKLVELLDDEQSWIYNKDEALEKLNENYNWEETGKEWVRLVGSITPKNNWEDNTTLISPPSFESIKDLPVFDFVKRCILNVVQDESLLGSILHCESLEHLENGTFIPENKITGAKDNVSKQVTKDMVYKKFFNMLENKVKWERRKNELLYQKTSK